VDATRLGADQEAPPFVLSRRNVSPSAPVPAVQAASAQRRKRARNLEPLAEMTGVSAAIAAAGARAAAGFQVAPRSTLRRYASQVTPEARRP
jgi:hypothetical protein